MGRGESWTRRISWESFLYSCIVRYLQPPFKCSLLIVLHLSCATHEEHRWMPAVGMNWKHDRLTSFSDGFIYFDYRPPSGCWLSSLQAGNGNGMGNRPSLVIFQILFWKAIISASVVYVCHNQQAWLVKPEPGRRRYMEINNKQRKCSRSGSLEVKKDKWPNEGGTQQIKKREGDQIVTDRWMRREWMEEDRKKGGLREFYLTLTALVIWQAWQSKAFYHATPYQGQSSLLPYTHALLQCTHTHTKCTSASSCLPTACLLLPCHPLSLCTG